MNGLQNLWLVTDEGNMLFSQIPDQIGSVSHEIMNGFFAGLQKFMSDLGGGEFYHLAVKDSVFIGINAFPQGLVPIYLIAQFESNDENKANKFHKKIQKLVRSFPPFSNDILENQTALNTILLNALKKEKLI